MKSVKTILAAVLAASCAVAQSDNAAVTRAATDPSTIHNAVAELSGVTIQAFAAEVIDAIAAKPQAPVSKVLDLVDASSNFLAESDESNLADVIVAMISNVPFEALPEWTSMMFDAVQDATRDIEDAPYNKLVADVVSKIGDLSDYTDEDKVVVTTFAIKLLSRGVEDPTHEPLLSALAVVPPTYRSQVEGSLPSVFSGDYSSLLAGVDIIKVPEEEKGGKDEGGAAGGEQGGAAGGEEGGVAGGEEGGFEQTDGSETTTVVTPEGEPQEQPPVPKPYKGQ